MSEADKQEEAMTGEKSNKVEEIRAWVQAIGTVGLMALAIWLLLYGLN